MTTTASTRPASPAAPPAASGTGVAALPAQPAASDTPRRLRRYQLVTAVAVLMLGLIGIVQLSQLRAESSATPGLGVQQVRLGEVSGAISAAGNQAAFDAAAGSPSDQSAPLAQVAGLVVKAAAAAPARAEVLGSINSDLLQYGQLLSAGAFDRAEELRTSSLQPALDGLGAQSSEAVQTLWWTSPYLSLGLGLVVLIGLCWLSYQVAQRSHRVLNTGLVAAIVATVAIAGLAAAGTPVSSAAGLADNSVVQASGRLTRAQLAADSASRVLLDAVRLKHWDKATLEAFGTPDKLAADAFTGEAADRYNELRSAQAPVVTALAAGNWTKAGSQLTKGDAVAKAKGELAASISKQRASLSASATSDSTNDSLLFLFEVGAAVLAMAGAFLGVRGLQTRIEEYR